ncbi:tRNA dihydrouridine synthase DusB [bacterium]|nr:tRNA dihydrouridine synthase DusB [bacterium]
MFNVNNIHQYIVLAPMEDVTDLPFRLICKKLGADLVFTEFISSEALIRNIDKSLKKMRFLPEERPIAVQIFGGNTTSLIESAKIVEDSGADILDINCGCWVKKVVNNDAGAAFLKDPDRMAEMVNSVVNAVKIPVSVKTRIGWTKDNINILEVAQKVQAAGSQFITVHTRTRDMGLGGIADWDWINRVKEVVSIPVILNGDVQTAEDVQRAFATTLADGVMIARGASANPYVFKQAKELMNFNAIITHPTAEDRINLCLEHLALSIEYKGDRGGIIEFRKYYTGYLKGLFNAAKVRQKLMTFDNFNDIKAALYDFLEELAQYETTYERNN